MKKVALPVFSKTQQPKIKSVLGLIFPDVTVLTIFSFVCLLRVSCRNGRLRDFLEIVSLREDFDFGNF